MFRRALSSLCKVAGGAATVQLGAAAVALTDKELSKKPEWYKNTVVSVEEALKRLSKYGFIESPLQLSEAEESLRQVLDVHHPEIFWRLARILAEKAELSKNEQEKVHLLHEAKDLAKKALAAGGSAGVHKWYAIILLRLAKVDKKAAGLEAEAEKHLEKASSIDKNDPYTLHLLGVQQYSRKDYQAAIATLKKAESIKSGFSASNLFYLGAAQKAAGKKAEAIESLKQSIQTLSRNKFDGKAKSDAKRLLGSLGLKPEEYEVEDL